jgi:hypothetical protein
MDLCARLRRCAIPAFAVTLQFAAVCIWQPREGAARKLAAHLIKNSVMNRSSVYVAHGPIEPKVHRIEHKEDPYIRVSQS